MTWITLFLLTLHFYWSQGSAIRCDMVLTECQNASNWIRCYEDKISSCREMSRSRVGFHRRTVNASEKAEANPTPQHRVHIPSSALRKSRRSASEEEVVVVATVVSSTLFKQQAPLPKRGRKILPHKPGLLQGTVLGENVLFVKAGSQPVRNLSQPITLTFQHDKKNIKGTCVFWQESETQNGTGYWSTEGCNTSGNKEEFNCSCNHMSFFAVLVNPDIMVGQLDEETLSYITYVGSGLSAFFTFISLFIYVHLHRRRPEKAVSMHMQLTVALFCLHLGFLLCCLWVQMLNVEDSWVCRGLGLILHWSLLATFTWLALEGFHLYLLLVRVFNIYVRKYLLKLSLVGWGLPTLVAMVCGISGVYGKYILEIRDSNNHSSTSQICWMSSQFPHRRLVTYITVAYLGLVVLFNSCMLVLVVWKLRKIRRGTGDYESSSDWRKMNKEKGPGLWKDCITVMGLSCVLGLPWGLTSATYVTLTGIYVFTIFNCLQGLFLFLWSVALFCKSRPDNNSSVKDPSSQKIMTTSFNT